MNKKEIKIYITKVTPLLEEENFQKALLLVDDTRKEKVKKIKVRAEQARSLGAGLLLQYGLLESSLKTRKGKEVPVLEILKKLENSEGTKLDFSYGEYGKPHLKNFQNIYFNLSHSKDYAVCALGREEMGIDLQYHREEIREKMEEYLCTKEEKIVLNRCEEAKERKKLFYDFFSAKEATVKLLGTGMGQEFKNININLEDCTSTLKITKEKIATLEFLDYLEEYSMVLALKNM